jgi:hypothetical protein
MFDKQTAAAVRIDDPRCTHDVIAGQKDLLAGFRGRE